MVDIHAHILPGFDDGAQTFAEALQMARQAADDGIKTIIATPHIIYPDRPHREKILLAVAALREYLAAEGVAIEILPGAEVHIAPDLGKLALARQVMTFCDAERYLLLELPLGELPRFTEEAITVIEDHAAKTAASQPLMLYLAYPAPHTPWLPSKEFAGKSAVGMYGDFVMMVDAQIGRVLAALRRANMQQNTLVIFTSDNGPVWYEADVARFQHDSAGGLRGMKADAWEAGHRMPFLVRWPGRVQPASHSD